MRLKMKIEPMNAAATADTIGRLFDTPKAAVDRVAAALATKPK
jgi:hypothetical protein